MTREEIEKDIEWEFGNSCGIWRPFRDIIDNYDDKDIYDVMIRWAKKHGANFEKNVSCNDPIEEYRSSIDVYHKPEPYMTVLNDTPELKKWIVCNYDCNRYQTIRAIDILDTLNEHLRCGALTKQKFDILVNEMIEADLGDFIWDW
nr:MAG TPA: hypothetical protein [Bacteriophage sp.]